MIVKIKRIIKIALLPALMLAALFYTPACADKATLPEIDGWTSGEIQIIHLDTVSGNQGFWVRRNYISDESVPIRANFIGGKGPGSLYLPAGNVDSLDGPIGSGARHETVTIGGHRGILEHDPTIGFSLSLRLKDGTLTLESGAYDLKREIFLRAAAQFVDSLP